MDDKLTAQERATMAWRWAALSVYLLICFYDFVFVPIWFGLNRPDISSLMLIVNSTPDPEIRSALMRKLVDQHQPFTLMGGGLIHLSFGALLTGSALAKK